jgi:hypothetical protein
MQLPGLSVSFTGRPLLALQPASYTSGPTAELFSFYHPSFFIRWIFMQ